MNFQERLQQLFETGCPKCGQKDSFYVFSVEKSQYKVWNSPDGGNWEGPDSSEPISDAYIGCGEQDCEWEEGLPREIEYLAENAITALESLEAIDDLKIFLGYLKKTIKSLEPDYDVTQDPT